MDRNSPRGDQMITNRDHKFVKKSQESHKDDGRTSSHEKSSMSYTASTKERVTGLPGCLGWGTPIALSACGLH